MPKGNFMLNKRSTNRHRKPKNAAAVAQSSSGGNVDQPGSSSSAEESNAAVATKEKNGTKKSSTTTIHQPMFTPNVQWAPGAYAAFKILLSLRITSAIWSPIADCDEVYNYWEPLHLFLYGRGFQTWEYSPRYGLRSYAYVLLYYSPAKLFQSILPNTKVTTFYFVRCFAAFVGASADVLLYRALCRRVSNNVGRLYLFAQALSPGAFISAAAFLPSSFASTTTTLATAFWLDDRRFAAVFFVALGSLAGWPFAAVLGLPIALDMLIGKKEVKKFFIYAAIAGSSILACLTAIDTYFYGKLTLAPFNIVAYNVLSGHGSELYGVEPWTFYVVNLTLNWNLVAPLAASAVVIVPVVIWICYKFRDWTRYRPLAYVQISLWLWMAIFFYQRHKEERFMFPVYSFLCISAALSLDGLQRLATYVGKTYVKRRQFYVVVDALVVVVVVLFACLSVSRIFALYRNYYAPFDVYMAANEKINNNDTSSLKKGVDDVNLCVGKEWYRFPSSFFLPDNVRLQFVRSEFRGLLPKPYDDRLTFPSITRHVPTHMNDANLEEPTRYVDLDACDYLIDLNVGRSAGEAEPNYSELTDRWTILHSTPFLDSTKSNRFFRAFYVPFVGDRYCTFGSYNLLKKI